MMEDGAFKMSAGRKQLTDRFKAILGRHKRRQTIRNKILLGRAPPNLKVCSKRYDKHMGEIREGCMEENMLRVLIENYEDFAYYSMDMG